MLKKNNESNKVNIISRNKENKNNIKKNILISSNSIPLNDNDSSDYKYNRNIKKKIEKKKIMNIKGINIKIYNNKIIRNSTRASYKKQKKDLKEKDNKKASNASKKDLISSQNIKFSRENLLKLKNNLTSKQLNDQEMNSLIYEDAVELDKRSYCEYYISLLKKKQLILLTFIPTNDYNLMSLKISLFLVSFSLYITINAFFFDDDTMHKIYKSQGGYNILSQIPHILYSSVIPTVINILLKTLSLSEKDFLKIKEEKDLMTTIKKSKDTEKCIRIKFILFFIISLFLMLFFWYFISCFCAVYNNTQTILFKDTLISFFFSMLYPFAINLLPGIFRIPSLTAKKDKKCLYSFSQIIALI